MLDLAGPPSGRRTSPEWRPPIVSTVATDGTGVADLWQAVVDHRRHATESGLLERRRASGCARSSARSSARRLRQQARELCGEERWRELTEAVLDGGSIRGRRQTR